MRFQQGYLCQWHRY